MNAVDVPRVVERARGGLEPDAGAQLLADLDDGGVALDHRRSGEGVAGDLVGDRLQGGAADPVLRGDDEGVGPGLGGVDPAAGGEGDAVMGGGAGDDRAGGASGIGAGVVDGTVLVAGYATFPTEVDGPGRGIGAVDPDAVAAGGGVAGGIGGGDLDGGQSLGGDGDREQRSDDAAVAGLGAVSR